MTKKSEAVVLAHGDPKDKSSVHILADSLGTVNNLRALLVSGGLAPRDAVAVLRKVFPSMDKSTLSKCCNPDKYGCVLHPDGYAMLWELLGFAVQQTPEAPERPQERRRANRHKLTCRVAGRLPDTKYATLQRYLRMEGYETTQDWVTAQVDKFIERMEVKYGHP